MSVQQLFIRKIKELTPSHESLVDVMADVLGISTDSAYRRIREETALSFPEFAALCDHYQISFDVSSSSTPRVSFRYSDFSPPDGFKNYLKSILNDLEAIYHSSSKHITYAALDIPIFHYFKYPNLTAFKLLYWQKAIINDPQYQHKKFSQDVVTQEEVEMAERVNYLYYRIPTTEIWNLNTIDGLLNQVRFLWESGNFESEESFTGVIEDLLKMLHDLEGYATRSLKVPETPDSSYQFYQCEIEIGGNYVLVNRNEQMVIYKAMHTFNTIITNDEKFSQATSLWIENLMRKSVLISGVGEKHRYLFFKKIYQKVEDMKNNLLRG